jgi:hypothetical protein
MTYLPGAAGDRFIRLALLQQLTEAVKIHVWQPVTQLRYQPGRRGLWFSFHRMHFPSG